MHSVNEIILNARSGDTVAFRKLVEMHHRLAYSVAFRMLRNREDAEDIVQEAFVRSWKNLERFDMSMKFSTWLYHIVVNLCLDVLKSVGHRSRKIQVELLSDEIKSNHETPETVLNDRELMQIVWQRSEELTPKQKAVFVLRDLEGLSAQEVSEVLDLLPEQVKSNLYHARKKMSEWIKELR